MSLIDEARKRFEAQKQLDIARLIEVLGVAGFVVNEERASHLWRTYSERHWSAGWLSMDGWNDVQLLRALQDANVIHVCEKCGHGEVLG